MGRATPLLRSILKVLRRNPNMALGLVILTVVSLVGLFAPLLARTDPTRTNPAVAFQRPSAAGWFGTDNVGRDIYSRTIHGSRISLLVGLSVAALVAVAGGLIGLLVGYYRRLDNIVMRLMDGLMAFPALLLGLALMALLGSTVQNVIIAISVVETPRMVRVVRASVLSLREQEFVTAARALGAQPWRILGFHIFPNTLAPLIVQATFVFAYAIILEASLSFLGAGSPPYIPSWGNIMGQGRTYLQLAPWVTFFPGLFLFLTVLAINLVGDGLRDVLDPKLARRA
jgi:peptide/nickel transport system permease protein